MKFEEAARDSTSTSPEAALDNGSTRTPAELTLRWGRGSISRAIVIYATNRIIRANVINERNKHACEIYAGFALTREMPSNKIRIYNARAIHEIAVSWWDGDWATKWRSEAETRGIVWDLEFQGRRASATETRRKTRIKTEIWTVSLLFRCRYYIPGFICSESSPPPWQQEKFLAESINVSLGSASGRICEESYKRENDTARYDMRRSVSNNDHNVDRRWIPSRCFHGRVIGNEFRATRVFSRDQSIDPPMRNRRLLSKSYAKFEHCGGLLN